MSEGKPILGSLEASAEMFPPLPLAIIFSPPSYNLETAQFIIVCS
jgi:hypothetical protein